MIKTIRIWNGCKVAALIDVDESGGVTASGPTSGAHNSARVDIEIDPWAGLIVDHSVRRSPVDFRTPEE